MRAIPQRRPARRAGGTRCADCEALARWLSRLDPAMRRQGAGLLERYRRSLRRRGGQPPVERWQDRLIVREIPRGSSVLDLGCGAGDLLAELMRRRGVRAQGVELDAAEVVRCVERGVPVFQSDLDQGLSGFPDDSFDYVVLEETLQTLHRPLTVLAEMLRVGRHGIVSFPNFAWWRVRLSLLMEGRMPETERLPYRWYDTPNIHLFTLRDFLDWASRERVSIVKGFACEDGRARPLREGDNLDAEEALLFLRRRPGARRLIARRCRSAG